MTDIRLLDYKTSEELNKHKKNFYISNIINRNDIIDTTKTINMNIRCFSGFEGHYYYNGRDPLVNTAKELLNNINLKPEESYLFKYYEYFKPNTYGELYNLSQTNKLHKLREYVEKNFEFVGDKFSEKVRAVYYDKKTKKSIYGTTTQEERDELEEEGIDLISIPWAGKDN